MTDPYAYERRVYEAMGYYSHLPIAQLSPAAFKAYALMAHRAVQVAGRMKAIKDRMAADLEKAYEH